MSPNLKISLFLFLTFLSFLSFADGFICESPQGYLRIKIYNHTQASTGGTRKVAVMILSNPKMAVGERTIGVFHENDGSLIREASAYVASFDFRFKALKNAPQNFIKKIAKRDIKKLSISPNFSINEPLKPNAKLSALMKLYLRDGSVINGEIKCRRYLKREPIMASKAKSCAKALKNTPVQGELDLSNRN